MPLWEAIGSTISLATGEDFIPTSRRHVGGGCINATHELLGHDGRHFFVKVNDASKSGMFEAEADGLREIRAATCLRAPEPICTGEASGQAWLVLEYLDIRSRGNGVELGQRLARLHSVTRDRFGWNQDNHIGATPQPNASSHDWIDFWRRQRLGQQLELARRAGTHNRLQRLGEDLMQRLHGFFVGHAPCPSLLHGDLWSGNYGYADDQPVIFDPAVYYGDRETDLAMTELFGGFPIDFYAAYQACWPLEAGYKTRKSLYNLYHILNHCHLFGGGYCSQAENLMERLLAELK